MPPMLSMPSLLSLQSAAYSAAVRHAGGDELGNEFVGIEQILVIEMDDRGDTVLPQCFIASFSLCTWFAMVLRSLPYFAMPSYSATMIVPSLRIQMKSTRSGKSGLFGLGNVLCIADAAA